MNRLVIVTLLLLTAGNAWAQQPLKMRPDALPPAGDAPVAKAVMMAATVDEMAAWDRYPTYEVYLAMMQRWAVDNPAICTIDTIGITVEGRLILSAHVEGNRSADFDKPQFFYSSTIHGDEVTGYVMMLRLIDTLLGSYGSSQDLTDLIDRTAIFINPLANPDGTYHRGNATVQGAVRYNANGVDLNRNYPDPFGTAKPVLQQENEAMIDYFSEHNFRLSANLHGGSEVMNYPWDCFTSVQNPHPLADWWREMGKRFVDTARAYDYSRFRDVTASGVIAGGDWYVIHGGRQDYVNYYHNCLELTMEISTSKTLSSDRLPAYWIALGHSFINYIAEVHNLPEGVGIPEAGQPSDSGLLSVYPNPVTDRVTVVGADAGTLISIYDIGGRCLKEVTGPQVDLSEFPASVYTLRAGGRSVKIIKK